MYGCVCVCATACILVAQHVHVCVILGGEVIRKER